MISLHMESVYLGTQGEMVRQWSGDWINADLFSKIYWAADLRAA